MYSTNWGDFHAEVDAQFQLLGAAVVGSWEVLLTDAARSFRGRHGKELPSELYQRLSDAIVPMQQCIQSQTKALQHVVTQYAQQNDPPALDLQKTLLLFPTELEASWRKSCEYVQPIFLKHQLDAVSVQWGAAAQALQKAVEAHAQTHMAQPASTLDGGRQALANWREATVKTLEIELYARRAELCRALSA